MTEGERTVRGRLDRLLAAAAAPKPTGALVAFRVAMGAIVCVSAIRFLAYGWVDDLFVKPTFYFKYWGFAWVRPLPAPGMHVVFAAMAVLGACFAAGLLYRVVAPALFVLFAYVNLIDVTNWLNHYYLVGLVLLLSTILPLGRAGSLDARLFPTSRLDAFPAWCTWLLRFQVAVVYFYAGIAKLTSDWLVHAQPLNIWLHARTGMPVLGAVFDERWAAYFFSWGGCLFDTFIVAFLLWRKTRLWAYGVVIAFHATVMSLFPIGMFPFIMVSAVLVFMDADWPERVWGVVKGEKGEKGETRARAGTGTGTGTGTGAGERGLRPAFAVAMGVFCLVQVLVPLRHRLYGGNVLWHEQGMRFSWKVMVREKNGAITYLVESEREKRTWYVSPRRYLTDRQARELSSQPDLIVQLAHHVADDFRDKGHADVRVRVDAQVSLNGRPAAPMIDPAIDLARVDDGVARASWILPEPEGPPIHLKAAWSSARVASRSVR